MPAQARETTMTRMLWQAFIMGCVVGAVGMALLIGAIWVTIEHGHVPPSPTRAPVWSP